MTLNDSPTSNRLRHWCNMLYHKIVAPNGQSNPDASAKDDAKNRLKLVLMHDRTEIPPSTLETMRDELVEVISKYVEIDQSTLDLCLQQEDNTIALVANIAVVRTKAISTS